MNCIFCKNPSSRSKSEEHILPESLGNTDHTLPPGKVCDKCNNYFARKIEKPFLDNLYYKEKRFGMNILNKRKHIPPLDGIHLQSLTPVQFVKNPEDFSISVGVKKDSDESKWIKSIKNGEKGTFISPIGTEPDDNIIARFLGKVGLEALAKKAIDIPGGIEELINKPELDELRNFVRRGTPNKSWPFSKRTIYSPKFVFVEGGIAYEVLHEWDILITDSNEFYIVLILFGKEYSLNLGGPEIEGYKKWLKENDEISPLYSK